MPNVEGPICSAYQKTALSKVESGENAAGLLYHVQIVRKFKSEQLPLSGQGDAIVELPKDFNAQSWEVVGLVQDQPDLVIRNMD